jgi:hypothetical protein
VARFSRERSLSFQSALLSPQTRSTDLSFTLKGVRYAMWCLVRVDCDGKAFWLSEADNDGVRSLVSNVDSATIFWQKPRAEEAIKKFVALNTHLADHVKLVALDTQHYRTED